MNTKECIKLWANSILLPLLRLHIKTNKTNNWSIRTKKQPPMSNDGYGDSNSLYYLKKKKKKKAQISKYAQGQQHSILIICIMLLDLSHSFSAFCWYCLAFSWTEDALTFLCVFNMVNSVTDFQCLWLVESFDL